MITAPLYALAEQVLQSLRASGARVVTAESCTGGLIGAALTAVPGSSDVVEGGFITYANEAKQSSLGVPASLITAQGAVSEPVAIAMAKGALERSNATVSIAVTGVAGPGSSEAKPAGMVCLSLARKEGAPYVETQHFKGDRQDVRQQTVIRALELLQDQVSL